MADDRKCPYGSEDTQRESLGATVVPCGTGNGWNGWLCDMCKEDRADRRATKVAELTNKILKYLAK